MAESGTKQAETVVYARPGLRAITPYLTVEGAAAFLDFLKAAFGAEERLRVPLAEGRILHAEVGIGNGAVELSDASGAYAAAPGAIHLYVDDADATVALAVGAGATLVSAVADQHWGDRQGTVRDAFGNRWYIAKANWTPGTEGVPTVQPFLYLKDANKMIPFLEAAFGAESLGAVSSPEGVLLHGTMRIGDATLEVAEAEGENQPMPCLLHVYIEDADDAYANALAAGATSLEAPEYKSYGDRSAAVEDAWGNRWFIATYAGR